MKAGVYITNQDSFVYVRKDRSIAATLHCNSHADQPANVFVATSEKEQKIEAPEVFDGKAQRVADVPNGCTDPLSHLRSVREKLVPARHFAQIANAAPSHYGAGPTAYTPRGKTLHPQMKKVGVAGWKPTGYETTLVQRIEGGTAWMCGKKSARKHRKQGHKVHRLPNGAFVWWRA